MTLFKQEEREVARLFNGKRLPANSGGPIDVLSETFAIQCKRRATMSLAEIEREAVKIYHVGQEIGRVGILSVKRKAGPGKPTPRLIILTEAAWRELQAGQGDGQEIPKIEVAA